MNNAPSEHAGSKNCGERNRDQITALAANELSRFAAWSLRRHIAHCPVCRADWDQTREVWQGLLGLGSEQVPKHLTNQVIAALKQAGERDEIRMTSRETKIMRRKAPAFAVLMALFLVTAAVAGTYVAVRHFRPSAGFSDRAGRNWNLTTNFEGRIECYDAQGARVGTFSNDPGNPAHVDLDLTVGREHFHITETGRRELRDSAGNLLGSIMVLNQTKDQFKEHYLKETGQTHYPTSYAEAAAMHEQRFWKGGGERALDCSPDGILFFEQKLDLKIKIVGVGHVVVTENTDKPGGEVIAKGDTKTITPDMLQMMQAMPPAMRPAPLDPERVKSPSFTITVQGNTTEEYGYGDHFVKDAAGKTITVISFTPPPAHP